MRGFHIERILVEIGVMIVAAFDLDDTLYKEIDFVKSGYRAIARMYASKIGCDEEEVYAVAWNAFLNDQNAIDAVMNHYPSDFTVAELVERYRNHIPEIVLPTKVKKILDELVAKGFMLAIITDGRSTTQRNKIAALGLDRMVSDDMVIISEEVGCDKNKPDGFKALMDKVKDDDALLYYIGDNPEKDFYWPNKLGWTTICLLDDGSNIHCQDFRQFGADYQPRYKINSIDELPPLLGA